VNYQGQKKIEATLSRESKLDVEEREATKRPSTVKGGKGWPAGPRGGEVRQLKTNLTGKCNGKKQGNGVREGSARETSSSRNALQARAKKEKKGKKKKKPEALKNQESVERMPRQTPQKWGGPAYADRGNGKKRQGAAERGASEKGGARVGNVFVKVQGGRSFRQTRVTYLNLKNSSGKKI